VTAFALTAWNTQVSHSSSCAPMGEIIRFTLAGPHTGHAEHRPIEVYSFPQAPPSKRHCMPSEEAQPPPLPELASLSPFLSPARPFSLHLLSGLPQTHGTRSSCSRQLAHRHFEDSGAIEFGVPGRKEKVVTDPPSHSPAMAQCTTPLTRSFAHASESFQAFMRMDFLVRAQYQRLIPHHHCFAPTPPVLFFSLVDLGMLSNGCLDQAGRPFELHHRRRPSTLYTID